MAIVPSLTPYLPRQGVATMMALQDKALVLSNAAAELGGMLAPTVRQVLTKHMEVINSYYSNLIEGHHTEPREVRAAQSGDYSEDPFKRNLQLESLAHIRAQQYLWERADALSYQAPETLLKIHEQVFAGLPDEMLMVTGNDGRQIRAVPGRFRECDVDIGRHLPPPHAELTQYLDAFAEAYDVSRHGGVDKILAVMAAHHRLVWIHPFIDGNGRVARLHTDLGLKQVGVKAVGIWCLSRGLARRVAEYKRCLQDADADRQGDGGGRGARSEKALIVFIDFMLDTALDQVRYIGDLLKPDGMRQRIEAYVTHRGTGLAGRGLPSLKKEAIPVLQHAFVLGEIQRKDMEQLSGLSLPSARKLFQQLKEEGLLTETSNRSPLYWAIPEHAEPWYFPDLSAPAAKVLGAG